MSCAQVARTLSEMQQVELPLEWWTEIYEKDGAFWHLPAPHDYLVNYFERHVTAKHPKVLIPLIGNTVDAKWLYDQGCEVTGVDICEKPVKLLYDQHKLAYEHVKTETPEFSMYHNDDHRIKVYLGNFYQFGKEVAGSQFDFIWDRAAFTAINVPERKKYVEVLKNVMAPHGSLLLIGLNYDVEKFEGPPHFVTEQHMNELFGADFTVKLLNQREVIQQWHKKDWGIDWLEEKVYLLNWKGNCS